MVYKKEIYQLYTTNGVVLMPPSVGELYIVAKDNNWLHCINGFNYKLFPKSEIGDFIMFLSELDCETASYRLLTKHGIASEAAGFVINLIENKILVIAK